MLFMEYLIVGISQMEQTSIIWLDHLVLIVMGLWPFVKLKGHIKNLRMD